MIFTSYFSIFSVIGTPANPSLIVLPYQYKLVQRAAVGNSNPKKKSNDFEEICQSNSMN
jgi:hypothetical protein